MSFIICLSKCIYQKDGVCFLDKSVSTGYESNSGCIYYIPKDDAKFNELKADINIYKQTDITLK